MRIDAPLQSDIDYVALHMRDRDAEEFLAVSRHDTKTALAVALSYRFAKAGDVFCAYDGDVPAAIGAMVQHRPNVVTLMFFATDRFAKIAAPLTRFITKRLLPRYRAAGVHRIECVSIAGYDEVHRWIEFLGLKREAVLPGYGRDGQTFVQFAWVADDCPSGA